MRGMTSNVAPEYEAHLINNSDWILRDGTVYLGMYEIAHYKDFNSGHPHKWERYALYALPERSGLVSFGAHYGDAPDQYLSYCLDPHGNPMNQLGSSEPINVAIIRYLMLKR